MIEVGVATMGWPFVKVAEWAHAHGVRWIEAMAGPVFDASEQAAGDDAFNLGGVLRDGPGRIQDILAAHNVAISAIAPMLNLLDANPVVRRDRATATRQAIDAAVMLEVSTVVVYGGSSTGMFIYGLPAVGPGHPSNTVEQNLALFREVMTPLADYAESKGVRIAMETAPRGGGHGNVAHNPELWDRIFEAVPSPALGLSFDPSHLVWRRTYSGPSTASCRRDGSRIFHMDGKDTEILPMS